MKKIIKKGKCDYCGNDDVLVRPSPYWVDNAKMCKKCWEITPIGLPFNFKHDF